MKVLPFYAVCDVSASMGVGHAGGGAPIQVVNSALAELHSSISLMPAVADKARFGLITFGNTAEVAQPLCDLSMLPALPVLSVAGATGYGNAFRLLKETIESDVAMLKADDCQVFRPAVFFLSDGEPTDTGWEQSHDDLVSPAFPFRPNIISFGVGQAGDSTIARTATLRAYVANDSSDTTAALQAYAEALTNSIVMSTTGGSEGELVLPSTPPGFTAIPLDVL